MSLDKLWSFPVRAEDIPADGAHFALEADAIVRAAVARATEILEISRLTAEFDLSRQGRNTVRVVGAVSASVRQTCVVTLEPMTNEIAEPIDLTFAPSSNPATSGAEHAGGVEQESSEPLVDGAVDLGAIAAEALVLGIDPYPRKPDAVFAAPATEDSGAHPFAALAALKKPDKEST